jgi:hypothetical protein
MRSNTPESWVDYLTRFGPLLVVRTGAPSHAVVLTGGDGGWFHINDPSGPMGKKEVMTFRQLGRVVEGAVPYIDDRQVLYLFK